MNSLYDNQTIVLAVLITLFVAGCTFIGFNSAPVTTIEKDNHSARGTNAKTWDTTISPR
jgi:hypothetical protein